MGKSAVAEPPAETPTKSGNQPIFKRKLGPISVAVFADEVSTSDGKVFTAHNIALQKSWQTKSGSFEDRTIYLDRNDVMKVIAGLHEAFLATYDKEE